MFLENKVYQKLKLSKHKFNKKCAPKLLFLIEKKKIRKIRMISDTENSLCKPDFGTLSNYQ